MNRRLPPPPGRVVAPYPQHPQHRSIVGSEPSSGRVTPPNHTDTSWAKDPARGFQRGEQGDERSGRPLDGIPENEHGGSVIVEIGDDINLPPQFFNAVVKTAGRSENAELITVTLGVTLLGVDNSAPPGDVRINAHAIVEWGVGSANYEAKVDWINGTTFTIPASAVKIGLEVTSLQGDATTTLKAAFTASLSYGSAPGRPSSGARYTKFVTDWLRVGYPITAVDPIEIPTFATAFNIIQFLPASLIVQVYEAPDLATYINSYNVFPQVDQRGNQTENAFVLPNGARWLRIANVGVLECLNLQVVFSLAF